MTQDVIALTPEMPDIKSLMAAVYAGGPDLRMDRAGGGAVAEVCGADGQVLVSFEAPRFIQVPGETARLLGSTAETEAPVWWTEARATTMVEDAGRLAGAMAGRLTTLLGGSTWPRGAASTEVVTIPAMGQAATPAGIDMLTDRAVVVIQDRPVVAATTWLTEVMRTTMRAGRELNIVTPPGTRLTLPTRSLLEQLPSRWVVQDPECGYYDGLSGLVLRWHEGRFAPSTGADGAPRVAKAFQSHHTAASGGQLLLSVRTIHPANERLVLGGALECAWRALTGSPPAGWSAAEPVNVPWSPRQLTDLARTRARQSVPTWLVAVGSPDQPAIATVRIVHTSAGVEEHLNLAFSHSADHGLPVETVAELAEALARRHNLATMVTELRAARTDLTTPAHWEPPPVPLSVTLGPDAVADLGLTRARRAVPDVDPVFLGPAQRPAVHYQIGDGAAADACRRFKQLSDHLKVVSRGS
ncbi:DUF6177 family protein [Streptomyces sclerotialus]|uniref:DUF6177 family protein n=1 Tax=Streptomyces sclerotialus TaxID=1957 RepID=UPI0004CBA499